MERIVYQDSWQKHMGDIIQEWTETGLLATVLWTADMAFLAINDISIPAQLGSLVSTAFALSSVITALLQTRRYRGIVGASSEEVADHLQVVEGRSLGLFPLAITYSLPYALLIWSVVFFGSAILCYSARFWSLMAGKATIFCVVIIVVIPAIWTTFFQEALSGGRVPKWQAHRLSPLRIREILRSLVETDHHGGGDE